MKFPASLSILAWASVCLVVQATSTPVEPGLRYRNAPGKTELDTIKALRRSLSHSAITGRDRVFENSSTLDQSWNGAVLYKQAFSQEVASKVNSSASLNADVEITCTTCYTKGTVTGKVSITGDFNATEAYQNLADRFETEAKNITDQVVDIVQDVFKDFADDLDLDSPPPTIDLDFDLAIEGIPQISLEFRFDDLELYMQLDTSLSIGSTYTLSLFKSETPLGYAISDELLLGVVLDIDIILDAEAEIDISSGFHLKFDDGLSIDIELFNTKVSHLNFPGGQFEFLPVTITTPGASLKAVLRVGIHAGIAFNYDTTTILGGEFGIGAGIEGSVFANVAEFVTNVTTSGDGNSDCDLQFQCRVFRAQSMSGDVVEYYEFAVGAAAGATAHLGTNTWGPTPNTTTAIFYTTLADACATQGTKTSTAPVTTTTDDGFFAKRDHDWSTTSTEIVYTAQACKSSGLVNCPASLQTTTTYKTELTTAVPSGSTPTFPLTVFTSVTSTIPFGTNAKDLISKSGTPTSYEPGATGAAENFVNGHTGGVSNKVIIGVSVGVGLPVLIAAISLCFCLCKARRRKSGQGIQSTNIFVNDGPYSPEPQFHQHKQAMIGVSPESPYGFQPSHSAQPSYGDQTYHRH
ncbi:Uu.00g007630.m01.CDS01 [Anthostomella pinea]|uniref:Uu.00g007630.m01.CDS01 n=1 Tax=Anthostomella pinea TaxID=933095 RepID=A0AAI8VXQ6_9PEZI|nr:Uu.00g007630.m01.CDS01 [Anthostomella pinea]